MVVGLVAAAANGTGMPLMIIIFGEMTNSFVLSGVEPNGKKLKLDFSTYWLCFAAEAKIPFPHRLCTGTHLRECIMSNTHPAGNKPVISINL